MRYLRAAVTATVLTVLIGTVGVTAAAAARGGTTTSNVRPVTASGLLKPTYHVTATRRHASCSTHGSEIVRGADRCFAGNFVLDPCWVGTNSRGAYIAEYCLSAPWSHSVLRLKGARPHTIGHGRGLWALRLRSGARCGFVTGATFAYHGKRANFGCRHNRWLVGRPDRSRPTWTIVQVTVVGGTVRNAHRVRIDHAWFGISG